MKKPNPEKFISNKNIFLNEKNDECDFLFCFALRLEGKNIRSCKNSIMPAGILSPEEKEMLIKGRVLANSK